MTPYPGFFVTIEGLDGSGKTTVTDAIEARFDDVERTQEPSELWTGKQVRRAISNSSEDVHPFTTFYLFMADRKHHIEKQIRPALEAGRLVVSDRYADSTLAYQPVALGAYLQKPQTYMRSVMRPWNLEPDLTLFLDTPIEDCVARMDGTEEYEHREFLEQVQANYDTLMTMESHRVAYIDGAQSEAAMVSDAVDAVENALDARRET